MKKKFFIVLINTVAIVLGIFILEAGVWAYENIKIKVTPEYFEKNWPLPFHPKLTRYIPSMEWFPMPENDWGRAPDGLEYTKKPIVIFGCSYAYGFLLDKNETFSHLLSEQTKRPVYNRAAAGWGIQHMLYQTREPLFYKKVPEPEYVIYIQINDHFRRLYVPTFLSSQILNEQLNLRYKYENGHLVLKDKPDKIKDFFKKSYVLQEIEHGYINYILLSEKNYDTYSKFALEHYKESKEELEKHWKNTKFIVLLYQRFYNDEEFKKELEELGYSVFFITDLTDVNLYSPEYLQSNYHPTAKAWEVLTPEIIKVTGID